MGLCKCPKRKVTNQFCFEHRVNVCEHCMVAAHANCVVQSYLAWLQVNQACNIREATHQNWLNLGKLSQMWGGWVWLIPEDALTFVRVVSAKIIQL